MLQQKESIVEEKYGFEQAKYKANTITANDLQSSEYSVETSKLDVSSAQSDEQSLEYNFKNLLNLPFDDNKVAISGDLAYSLYADTDIDALVNQAMPKNTDIYSKTCDYNVKQKIMTLASKFFKAGDTTYDEHNYDLLMSKVDLDNAKTTLEVNVRNKYNDLLSQADKLTLSEANVKLADDNYKDAQLKYNQGMIGKEDVLTANSNFLDAQLQDYTDIHDYNILEAEFENMVGQ